MKNLEIWTDAWLILRSSPLVIWAGLNMKARVS
jgi:hypothetical protein